MELSVQNLYGLLLRSRLMPQPDAQAMLQRWQTEAKDGGNHAGQFAKWMVRNSYVTEYQATLLARGHAEGFFLNQYKVLDRRGKGRMAGVYKGLHPLGQVVAIKVLPPSKAKDPQLFGRFLREARLSVTLKHRNIVRTFQDGEANGLHYLVMEYLEGETLDEVLQRRGKLMPSEAVPIVHQALLGLQHMHEKNMVHRDLKPSNLMLIRPASEEDAKDLAEYTVKILDIGLARTLSDETAPEKAEDPPLTTEGILLGTPDYMAPEQAREARSVDIRADIYSLGCVLYHALAGQPPFVDTNIISQMIRHASEPARPLKEFNPAVPDGLQQIIDYMMAKEPANRYQTPERAAQALQVFLIARGDLNREPAVDEKMSSYLTWLEREANSVEAKHAAAEKAEQPEKAAPAPAAKPSAPTKPVPAVPAAAPAPVAVAPVKEPARTRPDGSGQRTAAGLKPSARETKEMKLVQPVEESATVLEPEPEFDVDLVPVGAVNRPPAMPRDNLRLSRRDFLFFGIGAGTVIFALAVGKVLAWLFPLKRQPPPPTYLEGDSRE
jgi:eukaryotic-like serine/threonine-protein kinase